MKAWIVTPSYNQCEFLGLTLRSILSQEGPFDLRCVVMDGGSTDGTVDLLKSITDPRVEWVSQKDKGQSDAINQGLARTGRGSDDVVTWLNSDDLHTPGTLAAVVEAFTKTPTARWLVGRCQNIDAQGKLIRPGVTRYKDRALLRYSRRALLRENFICQMSVFWRGDFGAEIAAAAGAGSGGASGGGGMLDESLDYTMDYDLWLRMADRCDPVVLDRVLGQFRIHAASKSGRVDRGQFDEQFRVASKHFGDDRVSRWVHRFNVEKIVWAYRVMRLLRV
ncbi:MAG: glycosyltransferase family 2 protein [Planctomycetota bacterium]|nr:glycosyltransferase family 2 protein [Planctomycetota bacterium]